MYNTLKYISQNKCRFQIFLSEWSQNYKICKQIFEQAQVHHNNIITTYFNVKIINFNIKLILIMDNYNNLIIIIIIWIIMDN